ncbi:MAG: hypothetical protein CFE40_14050 [Burkholderiales bacterium PBB1]|nr:MAG: hypothetical protein CFE40_14050 [Burkholderiales bacterium PBB1]
MAISLAPEIDKFRVGIACTGQEFPGACERLKLWSEELKLPYSYLLSEKGGKAAGVGLYIPEKIFGFYVYIAVRTMFGQSYRISYDMNGTDLNAKGLMDLQKYSAKYFSIIDEPGRDLQAALLGGEFTYLEICKDILYKNSLDLLLHKVGSGLSWRYFKDGVLGEQTSGEWHGPSQMVLYNKSSELAANGKKSAYGETLRLERRMTQTLTLKQVLEIEQPFIKARIYDVEKLMAMNMASWLNWPLFIAIARVNGVAEALSFFTDYQKKLFRAALENAQVKFFRPTYWDSDTWQKNVVKRLHLVELLAMA